MIERLVAILTVLSLILVCFPVSATETNTNLNVSDEMNYSSACYASEQIYCTYEIDVNSMHLYTNSVIQLDFDIFGISSGEIYTAEISSSIEISHNILSTTEYTYDNNHASLTIKVLDDYTVQSLDSYEIEHITVELVKEGGNSDYSIDISLLNTQYGVFVSYINDECLIDSFANWLKDNSYISTLAYDQYVLKKHTADVTVVSNAANVQAVAETTTAEVSGVYTAITVKLLNSGASLSVSGNINWKRPLAGSFPARGVKVDIYDRNGMLYEYMYTCYADANGYFSITFANDTSTQENGSYDISVRINAVSQYASVGYANLTNDTTSQTPHYFYVDFSDDKKYTTTMASTYTKSENCCQAFEILDAVYTGGLYVKAMSGKDLSRISVRYPYTGLLTSHYEPITGLIYLKDMDNVSWDETLHEYGHYVANEYDIYPFTALAHDLGVNAITYICTEGLWELGSAIFTGVKYDGCVLAW